MGSSRQKKGPSSRRAFYEVCGRFVYRRFVEEPAPVPLPDVPDPPVVPDVLPPVPDVLPVVPELPDRPDVLPDPDVLPPVPDVLSLPVVPDTPPPDCPFRFRRLFRPVLPL